MQNYTKEMRRADPGWTTSWVMKNLSIAFLATLSLASFGCKKKGGDVAAAMQKMGEFTDRMCGCKDKDCASKVNDDMTKWMQDMSKTADKNAKPSEADQKKMEESAKKFGECNAKLMVEAAGGSAGMMAGSDMMAGSAGMMAGSDMMAGSAMAGSGEAMAATGDMPAECADYKAAMEKFMMCDGVPQASKDGMKQGFDAMSASWANMAAMPAESKAAMLMSCKTGADALRQSATAMKCTL